MVFRGMKGDSFEAYFPPPIAFLRELKIFLSQLVVLFTLAFIA